MDTDLPTAALAFAGAALCTVLADFGGETLVLAFARTGDIFLGGDTLALLGLGSFGMVCFVVPGIFFLISVFLAVADRCGFLSSTFLDDDFFGGDVLFLGAVF